MKKHSILFIALLLACLSGTSSAQCKLVDIIQANKLNIPTPYKYDGFTMTNITFDQNTHLAKTEFVAFKGQKYKLIFCTSGFEEEVNISVFDKANTAVKVTEKLIGNQETSWTYEIRKSGNYTFVFDIPAGNTGVARKECIVMLIGFSEK